MTLTPMDWLKKKKEEAKQAAAKISNKRTAFRGEGNVLGGTTDASAPPPAAASRGPSIKVRRYPLEVCLWLTSRFLTTRCLSVGITVALY